MPFYQALILGLVQGLTEFLPISSTAHLALAPWLLGWRDQGLTFDVALHAGTLVAVLGYFLRTWVNLLAGGLGLRPSDQLLWPGRNASGTEVYQTRRLFWYLVLATFPAGIAGFLGESYVESTFRQPAVMGTALVVVGLVMWYADQRPAQGKTLDSVSLADALVIGFAQAIALVPGVSRSAITITAALFCGLRRDAAARFSFLLSTPIIAGAAAKKLLEVLHGGLEPGMGWVFAAGFVASAIVGYLVIAFFLRYLQTHTLKIFVYYRILLGIVVLSLEFLHIVPRA